VEDEITSQNQSLMTPRATLEEDSTFKSQSVIAPRATIEEDSTSHNAVNTFQQPRSIRNIGLELNEANILTGRRVRRPQRHAYAVRRQEIHKTQLDNVDNALIYHMAFSIAATFIKARIHSTELPAPPNH
jgi:hypothetical protein